MWVPQSARQRSTVPLHRIYWYPVLIFPSTPSSICLPLKGKRDRAILAIRLYHALRREELHKLLVKDFKHERRGVAHPKISSKGGEMRYIPLHPAAGGLILDYRKRWVTVLIEACFRSHRPFLRYVTREVETAQQVF
jgi:integrase